LQTESRSELDSANRSVKICSLIVILPPKQKKNEQIYVLLLIVLSSFSFAQNIDLNKGIPKTVITPKYNLNMLMEKS
jgi:hypothetical protein